MSDRDSKLDKLRNKQTIEKMQIITDGKTFFEIIEATIDEFQKVAKGGIELNNVDVLFDRLERIADLEDSVESLKKAIKEMPKVPEEIRIASANEIVEALKQIKIEAPEIVIPEQKQAAQPPDYTGAVKRMADALAQLAVTVKAAAPKAPSQRAADYVPFRRVIKKGNTFVYDDTVNEGASAGGGGGTPLVKTAGNIPSVPVSNPDGTPINTDTAHPTGWKIFEDHTSAQTNNQLKAAPGSGLSLYITDIIFSNGATAGSIKLVEDEGGTPVQLTQTIYMAINGGAVMHFETPIKMTANKSLGFTSTTVTTHSVEVHGYIAA